MPKLHLHKEGHCYVLMQGDWIHPIAHQRFELLWYPERGMSLFEQHLYKPFVKSIVTENPWLIATYPRERVWVVSELDGRWENPDAQTYGASVNSITFSILGIQSTIPRMVLDGGRGFNGVAEYKKLIEKATDFYSK